MSREYPPFVEELARLDGRDPADYWQAFAGTDREEVEDAGL